MLFSVVNLIVPMESLKLSWVLCPFLDVLSNYALREFFVYLLPQSIIISSAASPWGAGELASYSTLENSWPLALFRLVYSVCFRSYQSCLSSLPLQICMENVLIPPPKIQ